MSFDAKVMAAFALQYDNTLKVYTTGSLFVSTTSGVSWMNVGVTAHWNDVQVSSSGSVIVASTSTTALYLSTNSGASFITVGPSNAAGVAVSSDGKIIAAVVNADFMYISKDYGSSFQKASTSNDWNGISMNADGSIIAAIANQNQIYISYDTGASFTATGPFLSWWTVRVSTYGRGILASSYDNNGLYPNLVYRSMDAGATWDVEFPADNIVMNTPIALSGDGSVQVIAPYVGSAKIFMFSLIDRPAQQYNLPAMSYDETISVGSNQNLFINCPASSSKNVTISQNEKVYHFCNIEQSSTKSLINNAAWQKAQPAVNKKASNGLWQFGSWGFCLDSSRYGSCDSQFKGDICNSGYFRAMMANKICGKYRQNGPFLCTRPADLLNAISFSIVTALFVISMVVSILAWFLGKYFGEDFDGALYASTAEAKMAKENKMLRNSVPAVSLNLGSFFVGAEDYNHNHDDHAGNPNDNENDPDKCNFNQVRNRHDNTQ
jgi:hypothetical protein